MSITLNNAKIREVINQVVNDPYYKKVSKVPLFSIYQIGLILLAYTGFIGGIALYYFANVSLWIVLPLMGLSSYLSFTPLHDATHRATSSNKFLNDALGTISAFLLFPFLTTPVYRYLHLSHHRFVGDDDLDPDSILVSFPTKYFPFGYLILPFFDLVAITWAFTKGWFRLPKTVRLHLIFSTVLFFSFHIVFLSSSYWLEFILFFIIPTRLGITYTAYTFAHIQHPDGVTWHEFPFESTHVMKGRNSNFLLKSLLGQEHHAMHHFLPHIPWYKYHKVWQLGNGIFTKQNIPERDIFEIPDKKAKEKIKLSKEQEITSVKVKISAIIDVAKNIKSFTFEPLDSNDKLPEFSAGSHININLPSGKVRSYSLINPPYERHQYVIAVKKEDNGKGGSKEMHDLDLGDILEISIPKNNFVLYENTKRFILISGGIGITPMISMAHRLEEIDKQFEFHICAKEENEVPFLYELKNWSFAPKIDFHYDENGKSAIELSKVLSSPNSDTLIYVCGPSGFNNWIKNSALELGWQKDQIKQELFSADVSQDSLPKEFELLLNKSNKTITVAENMTIIDAIEMENIKVDYSCLQGTCGTCIANVIDGEIDHRDAVLSEEEKLENSKICLCVSRAKHNKLIIDL